MPPKYKSRKCVSEANDYESDGGFVDDVPKSKRSKTTQTAPSKDLQTDGEDTFWEISGKRRVQISKFNGKQMVNIREFYEKEGKMLPGKKGISLSVEQFAAVIELLPQIENVLKSKGEDLPRPDYDSASMTAKPSSPAINDAEDEEDAEDAPAAADSGSAQNKLDQFTYSKGNYEATSEEDDE